MKTTKGKGGYLIIHKTNEITTMELQSIRKTSAVDTGLFLRFGRITITF